MPSIMVFQVSDMCSRVIDLSCLNGLQHNTKHILTQIFYQKCSHAQFFQVFILPSAGSVGVLQPANT